jgi:hypothetical protein
LDSAAIAIWPAFFDLIILSIKKHEPWFNEELIIT